MKGEHLVQSSNPFIKVDCLKSNLIFLVIHMFYENKTKGVMFYQRIIVITAFVNFPLSALR